MPPRPVDLSGRPFHFIGIGGIGMSALAYILTKRGIPVSGSDVAPNGISDRLASLGVRITAQDGSALRVAGQPLPQVVWSTAIGATNVEYQLAQALGCPLVHRSDVLAALAQEYESILVAGTHGKTTTSGLIGHLLLQAGWDPTIVIGGEVSTWGGNARLGQGRFLVAEADESDGTLVNLQGQVGVITNIEWDHTNHFACLADVVETFRAFAANCEALVVCTDCPTAAALVASLHRPVVTYGLKGLPHYGVQGVDYTPAGIRAQVVQGQQMLGELTIPLLGAHNLRNTLAAVAVCRELGMGFDAIQAGVATFAGARRRFELRGQANGIEFYDDYAHHPSEIRATLSAARQRWPQGQRRLVVVFQPHRYSRTASLLPDFGPAFAEADLVVLVDIYGAGEGNPTGVTGEDVAAQVRRYHHQVQYIPTLEALEQELPLLLRPGDAVLFLGAGNLNRVIPRLMTIYQADAPVTVG
ncbi:MAG: UDP-N-acetylmuramate--L-alanine ligase [Gloeomargarita sp. SKYBB_i_bin120]|nr:UDP-N-acetylmuramate--L-alanine ligase [Gloeomargarita sp. SKYG98]MCS7292119.1 UDP-N-acetylmuramate--L-alanine ligase [Gloeomargarita sp. SKYB120]MDW8177680.1 UDP-N-acetylmuramate--L-alanine ligase [Gloeomargarita sp. SKYBB_i_bin120]